MNNVKEKEMDRFMMDVYGASASLVSISKPMVAVYREKGINPDGMTIGTREVYGMALITQDKMTYLVGIVMVDGGLNLADDGDGFIGYAIDKEDAASKYRYI